MQLKREAKLLTKCKPSVTIKCKVEVELDNDHGGGSIKQNYSKKEKILPTNVPTQSHILDETHTLFLSA